MSYRNIEQFGSKWKLAWVEDDSGCYDRETPKEAWNRIYKEPMPDRSTADETFDGGDHTYYRFGNRLYCCSYDGGYIYDMVVSETEVSIA